MQAARVWAAETERGFRMTKTAILHAQQRWEYQSITRRTEGYLADELNTLGQDGWELVSITHGKDLKGEVFWAAFVKRPLALQARAGAAQERAAAAQRQSPVEAAKTEPAEAGEGFDLSGEEFQIKEE